MTNATIEQDEDSGQFEACCWGSHPDAGNDDFWNSYPFATVEEATKFAQDGVTDISTMWIEVARNTGEVTEEGWVVLERVSLHRNPGYRKETVGDDWLEE